MMTINLANTGDRQLDRALNELRDPELIRKVVVPSARAGLKPVAEEIKRNSVRTNPVSMRRPPVGSANGPSSRYVGVRAIRGRSKVGMGARTIYNTTKFPRFVVTGKRSGKRFFYPAIQEYGTQKAKPPIKPKKQASRAWQSKADAALAAFATEFRNVYPVIVEPLLRKHGGG